MPRRSKARLAPIVEAMDPPISSVGWSPQLVAQTLEVLPVAMQHDALVWMKPVHADSLRIGLPASTRPADAVLDVLKWYPLEPVVVHSTSWRHEDGRVILTYIAVVTPPEALPRDSLVVLPVKRAKLARGEAMAAAPSIGVEAVLEHALRHLSWLVRDDPAVMEALAGWRQTLAAFEPEPFRSLS